MNGRRASKGLRVRAYTGVPSIAALSVIIVALFFNAAEAVTDETGLPLSSQLDGLPPEARIAYLRHLISQGKAGPDASFLLAVAFHENGQIDSAVTWYGAAIDDDPEDTRAYVNLGVLYDEQRMALDAEASFRKALEISPDDLLANSHLAYMLFRRREFEYAWGYLSRALETDPDHPQPHFYLAIFFWENRMYREALVEWEKVLLLDPDSYLGKKAEENIVMLQKALNAPTIEGRWDPEK